MESYLENPDLLQAVTRCALDTVLLDGIREIYARADRIVAERGMLCMGGGTCCRFDRVAHRLYVTVGELALLTTVRRADTPRTERNRCPYQSGPRCTARNVRPLGCRVFFCRQGAGGEANDIYEALHRDICDLHADRGVPYSYVELISALKTTEDTGILPLTR